MIKIGLFALLIAALGTVITCERMATVRLYAELGKLRLRSLELGRLTAENQDLAARAPTSVDLDRLRRERAEADALRAKIASLRAQLPTKPPIPANGKASQIAANDWKFAGRETPQATIQSVLSSAVNGNVDDLARLIVLYPQDKKFTDGWFSCIPDQIRAEYGTPEKIAAIMLAGDMPQNLTAMTILGSNAEGQNASLLVQIDRADGTTQKDSFNFRHAYDGWQLIVPPTVLQSYLTELSGAQPK